jgi:hypothetical protein
MALARIISRFFKTARERDSLNLSAVCNECRARRVANEPVLVGPNPDSRV